jgi:hypothetical protein
MKTGPPEPEVGVPAAGRQRKGRAMNGRQKGRAMNGRQKGRAMNGRQKGRAMNGRQKGRTMNGRQKGCAMNGRQKGRAMNGRQKTYKPLLGAPNLPSKQVQRWKCILLADRTCKMKEKSTKNR